MSKRKIPARKHHGIRDPIKQAEERFNKIKDKIDNPPINRNEQKVSNSFARFVKLKEATKHGKLKKPRFGIEDCPKTKGDKNKTAVNRPVKSLPEIRQRPDESDQNFLNRVQATTKLAMIEARYEKKYGVDVVRDKKTGEVTIQKRQDLVAKRKKNQLTDAQKQMVKDEIKKLQKQKNEQKYGKIQEYKKDEFKFGEVVHAPPVLSTLPRKATKTEKTSRPGKGNLLLTSLVKPGDEASENTSEESNKANAKKSNKVVGKVDLKARRKDLPMATRVMLEREREQTVERYRMLKKQNRLSSKTD